MLVTFLHLYLMSVALSSGHHPLFIQVTNSGRVQGQVSYVGFIYKVAIPYLSSAAEVYCSMSVVSDHLL